VMSEDGTARPMALRKDTCSPLTISVQWAAGQAREHQDPTNTMPSSREGCSRGVTCGDCHAPHSGKLRVPTPGVVSVPRIGGLSGPTSTAYAAAASRIAYPCHMPARKYMVSTAGTITQPAGTAARSVGKARTRRMPVTCHETGGEWAAEAIGAGSARSARDCRPTRQLAAEWATAPTREKLLAAVAADAHAPDVARGRARSRYRSRSSPGNLELARRVSRSGTDGADRRMGHAEHAPHERSGGLRRSSPTGRGVRTRAASIPTGVPAARSPPWTEMSFESAAGELRRARASMQPAGERDDDANFFGGAASRGGRKKIKAALG